MEQCRERVENMKRRLISWLLAVCMVIGLVPAWQTEARAADEYPDAFSTPALTGDQAYDAAAIARSQVGYTTKKNNYTAYTAEIGGSQGAAWCAYFVKWCLNRAGVTDYLSVSGGAGSSTSLWVYFDSIGSWHGNFYKKWSYGGKSGTNTKDSSYTPQVGDVVLLETGSSSDGPDHTGIVVGVSGSSVTTVEGNIGTADKVATFTYDRWSSQIWGFGHPKYTGGNSGGGSSSASSLSLSNATVPRAVKQGDSFSIYGTISSNYKINYAAVVIMDLDRNSVLAKQVAPGSYSYDVHSIDNDIPFGQLPAGTYYYQIEAKDASQNFQVLYYDQFVVYNDIGTDFYGTFMNTAAWQEIRNANGNVEIAAVASGKSDIIWKFVRNSDGSYTILSAVDGKALDADNYGTADGTNVQCYVQNDSSAQHWWIMYTSKGYLIRPAYIDKVLDLKNNDRSDGTNIQLWTQNGSEAQYWSIYNQDDVQLKGPTFSVNAGTTTEPTRFSWSDVCGETTFDVKIWNGTIWEGDPYHVECGVNDLSWSTTLQAGYYEAYVDAYNYFVCEMSNKVAFSIRPEVTVTAGTDAERTTFSWGAMSGAKRYDITIHSNESGKEHTFQTTGTSGSLQLSPGEYTITVAGYDGTHTLTSDVVKFTVKEHTHNYDNGTITTAPTCTGTGVRTYTCTICQKTKTETVAAAGHTWGHWAVTKAATETAEGIESRSCSVCKAAETRSIPKLAHTHNYQYAKTVAAACKTGGYDLYTCTCGATEQRNRKPATGHSYELRKAKAATCTAAGYTGDEVCTACGVYGKRGSVIPAAGHSWSGWKTVREATDTEDGLQERTCASCGAVQQKKIPSTGHEFAFVETVAPTCTEEGYDIYRCECGEEEYRNETNALGHSYALQNVVEATCTTEGYSGDWVCTRCGEASGTGNTVPALGHDWSDWTEETAATYLNAGTEYRTCTACGETETEEIPALGSPFPDVQDPGKYYYTPVLWAAANNITNGVEGGLFAPGNTCKREQVVTFLWRAMGSPEPTSTNCPFEDVAEGKYYYKAVLWAVENGITTGKSATRFAPKDTITRAEFVTFLWRTEGKPGYSTSNPFYDVSSGSYYYDAVLWASENGVTTGKSTESFAPKDPCTRGQVVTFLYRDLG